MPYPPGWRWISSTLTRSRKWPSPPATGAAPVTGAVEIPKDCLALVVGGPQLEYPQVVVDAFKKYVEEGGHALFMLENTLQIGRDTPAAENAALLKVLADWGVTVNKDL